jgi:hypothetical protein
MAVLYTCVIVRDSLLHFIWLLVFINRRARNSVCVHNSSCTKISYVISGDPLNFVRAIRLTVLHLCLGNFLL